MNSYLSNVLKSVQIKYGYLLIGLLALLMGYSYYLFIRGFDPVGLFPVTPMTESVLPEWLIWGFWPTFLHTFAFALISYALASSNRRILIASFWVWLNVVMELGQLSVLGGYVSGTFSYFDLLAALAGGGFFLLVTQTDSKAEGAATFQGGVFAKIGFKLIQGIIVLFGVLSITASGAIYLYPVDYREYEPKYLSYDALRAPLTVQLGRTLNRVGKIYTYQDYLFVSEPNQGVHIFDNTDSSNPKSVGFIVLPGNLDIAIKNGYLYADSFVDLVVIDLNDPAEPKLTKRLEHVFPWDAYQAIDSDEVYFYYEDQDESRGVIIGYKEVRQR